MGTVTGQNGNDEMERGRMALISTESGKNTAREKKSKRWKKKKS